MSPAPGIPQPPSLPGLDVQEICARVEEKLAAGPWAGKVKPPARDLHHLASPGTSLSPGSAAEVTTFALGLSGRRRAARRQGRLSRLLLHFAAAALIALSGVAAACAPPGSSQVQVDSLPAVPGTEAALGNPVRTEASRYTDLVLLEGGTERWALMAPVALLASQGADLKPVLVDRQESGLTEQGAVYTVPGKPISVGTRDGRAQFLDPLAPAIRTGDPNPSVDQVRAQIMDTWQSDERFLGSRRAILGQPTVMDAAYNGAAAAEVGGTHNYADGVVLRVDDTAPVLMVADKALVESGAPVRAEDVVNVAIREGQRPLFNPGDVVNLKNVVMERQESNEGGQTDVFYIANAALEGASVEPTGKIDLQANLNQRLQRVDQDLAIQADELAADPAAAAALVGTPQPTPTAQVQTQSAARYMGPSFVDDFLIFWWLTNSGWYRGSTTIINNPSHSTSRPGGSYYYVPPRTGSATTAPNTTSTTSRSTAIQAARNAVSGQASGTGGGVAATAKSAAESSARVSAASNKAAVAAGAVSAASIGKSTSSVTSKAATSPSAARSAGAVTSSSSSTSRSSGSSSSSVRSSGSSGFGGSGASSSGAS